MLFFTESRPGDQRNFKGRFKKTPLPPIYEHAICSPPPNRLVSPRPSSASSIASSSASSDLRPTGYNLYLGQDLKYERNPKTGQLELSAQPFKEVRVHYPFLPPNEAPQQPNWPASPPTLSIEELKKLPQYQKYL